MSFLQIQQSSPLLEIGEATQVMVGDLNTAPLSISTTHGKYVLDNNVYNQADYPELYARIGKVGGTPWTIKSELPKNPISSVEYNILDLTYGNGVYLLAVNEAAPGGILTSNDLITWTRRTTVGTTTIYALTYGNGLYVYGSFNGVLATSTNAITWTSRTSGTTSQINTLTYGNGLYVYGTNGGGLRTSTDAITWDLRTSGTTSGIYKLIYGNGLYVYAGTGGALATSTNGTTWTLRTSGTTSSIWTLTYGNGLYLYATGNGGALRTSTDGTTWTARTSGTSSTIIALSYGNGLYVYIDSAGSTGTSTDAITWNRTQYNSFLKFGSVVFGVGQCGHIYNNGLYTLGLNGAVYTSTSATQIESRPFQSTSRSVIVIRPTPLCDFATQFYVPTVVPSSRALTLPTYTNFSTPSYLTYVRAK
jgi:hypothetical protein